MQIPVHFSYPTDIILRNQILQDIISYAKRIISISFILILVPFMKLCRLVTVTRNSAEMFYPSAFLSSIVYLKILYFSPPKQREALVDNNKNATKFKKVVLLNLHHQSLE